MKIMTIEQAGQHFKPMGVPKTAIRRAVIAGEIPCVKIGVKRLLTEDNIVKWLNGDFGAAKPTEEAVGTIRVIAE